MAGSVSGAFAVLRGKRTGDPNEAEGLLDSLSPQVRRARSRAESKANSRPQFYNNYKMGMKINQNNRIGAPNKSRGILNNPSTDPKMSWNKQIKNKASMGMSIY